ncbi:hypothetical protein F5146DRAFT_201773 [Armillaria mellea]|nr:hypothetical protein F5146DRAFT_201773 [Armillaria mellea]
MTLYGMPIFLEDKSGRLTGSEFIDIHDRMRFSYRCTARDSVHTAYMIYNLSAMVYQGSCPRAVVALDFGPNNALGTVSFSSRESVPMKKYLPKISNHGGAYKPRKFVASDSQEYIWSYRTQEGQEWTCTNTSGYLVAYYSLKVPGEPHYEGSSGCTLTIDEAFGHIAAGQFRSSPYRFDTHPRFLCDTECLASLMIMRHIAEYNV